MSNKVYRITVGGIDSRGKEYSTTMYVGYSREVGQALDGRWSSQAIVTDCKEMSLPNLPVDPLDASMLDENNQPVDIHGYGGTAWFDNPVLRVGYKLAHIYNNNEEAGMGIDGWYEYDGIGWEYHAIPPFV
jgi:hypothetical protein